MSFTAGVADLPVLVGIYSLLGQLLRWRRRSRDGVVQGRQQPLAIPLDVDVGET